MTDKNLASFVLAAVYTFNLEPKTGSRDNSGEQIAKA
jgi:hypothetical protein